MSNGDPQDGFFYPTLKVDSYHVTQTVTRGLSIVFELTHGRHYYVTVTFHVAFSGYSRTSGSIFSDLL